MSIASCSSPTRGAQRGFTFLETTLVLAMTTLLAWVVERTFTSTTDADRHLAGVQKSTDRCQGLSYRIRELVSASRRLFGRDTIGEGYRDALQVDRVVPVSNLRLPVIDPVGRLVPDETGVPTTGNCLLFVGETDPAEVVVDATTGATRFIDMYRFVYVVPVVTGRFVTTRQPRTAARDLVIWRSTAYPSHTQILGLSSAAHREAAVSALVTSYGCRFAWDPSGAVDDSFFAMDEFGALATSPEADIEIEEDPDVSSVGSIVASGLQLAPSDTTRESYDRRAWMTSDLGWWPNGFETKIVGGSGSRKIWMRLTLEAPSGGPSTVVHASQVIASAHDL